jgi:hypothetical protein
VLKYKNDFKKQGLFPLSGKRKPDISSENLWRMTLRHHGNEVLQQKDKQKPQLFANMGR